MNVVEKEFFNKGYVRYGMFIFSKEVALEVITRCKELNIRILGIDTFLLIGRGIQPFQEYSPDYSYVDRHMDIWKKAQDFIISTSNVNSLFVFEITMSQ